jgi:hypothetical protein
MKSATALIALALCQGAWALPRDLAETELFKEYADCAGFHMTRAMVLDQEGREDEAARDVLPTVKQFHKLAEGLKSKDEANRAMFAAFKEQGEFVRNTQGGLGLVTLRYGASCKSLLADPEARMKYWLTQGAGAKGRLEQLDEVRKDSPK